MTEQDFTAQIATWLRDQGYPLEMEAAKAFRDGGFQVSQGGYYVDQDKGKPREIDLVASHHSHIADGDVYSTLVVECKASRNKPWLLFSPPSIDDNHSFSFLSRIASKRARLLLAHIRRHKHVTSLPFFNTRSTSAYAVTQAFTTGTDITYDAIVSATKAAHHHAGQIDTFDTDIGPTMAFVYPVVLIDARLFECQLIDGELAIEEIPNGIMSWRHPLAQFGSVIIDIVTRPALSTFVAEARTAAEAIVEACAGRIEELNERWYKDYEGR